MCLKVINKKPNMTTDSATQCNLSPKSWLSRCKSVFFKYLKISLKLLFVAFTITFVVWLSFFGYATIYYYMIPASSHVLPIHLEFKSILCSLTILSSTTFTKRETDKEAKLKESTIVRLRSVLCSLTILSSTTFTKRETDKEAKLKESTIVRQSPACGSNEDGEYRGYRGNPDVNYPTAVIPLMKNSQNQLMPGILYKVSLEMELPESKVNRDLGMFSVKVFSFDHNSEPIHSSTRSAMLHYKSFFVQLLQTIFFAPSFIMGRSEEKQKINIAMFEDFTVEPFAKIEGIKVVVKSCNIQIYDVVLKIEANLSGLRYYMLHWPLISASVGIGMGQFFLFSICLLSWHKYLWPLQKRILFVNVLNKKDEEKPFIVRRERASARGWLTRSSKYLDTLIGKPEVYKVDLEDAIADFDNRLNRLDKVQAIWELKIEEDMLSQEIEEAGTYREATCSFRLRGKKILAGISDKLSARNINVRAGVSASKIDQQILAGISDKLSARNINVRAGVSASKIDQQILAGISDKLSARNINVRAGVSASKIDQQILAGIIDDRLSARNINVSAGVSVSANKIDRTEERRSRNPTVSALPSISEICCVFCSKSGHQSERCKDVQELTVKQRQDKLKFLHLCYRCLGTKFSSEVQTRESEISNKVDPVNGNHDAAVLSCWCIRFYQSFVYSFAICKGICVRPKIPFELFENFKNLKLADNLEEAQELEVDTLIGLESYWGFMTQGFVRLPEGLAAQETVFDWVISGSWKHDKFTPYRYEVALPRKENSSCKLVKNKSLALSRLNQLSKKLKNDPELESQYNLFEFEAAAIIGEVKVPPDKFSQWVQGFDILRKWQIPRRYNSTLIWSSIPNLELHGFGDASEKGYGAAIYLRIPCSSAYRTCLNNCGSGDLSYDEITLAKLCLFKDVQFTHFNPEIHALKRDQSISKSSPIAKLTPFLGKDGLLRVKGRLDNSNLDYDSKHPIVLSKCYVTKLLVVFQHLLMKHAGSEYSIIPLTFVGDDIEDISPLTPSSFICNNSTHTNIEFSEYNTDLNLTHNNLINKYSLCEKQLNLFWSVWTHNYLRNLPPSIKKFQAKGAIEVGALVLIREDHLPRMQWPLGIVVDLYPGRDGLIRSVRIKTSKGEVNRPIQRLHSLEVNRFDNVKMDVPDPLSVVHSPTRDLLERVEVVSIAKDTTSVKTPVKSRAGRVIKPVKRLGLQD
ncbi:Seipin [Nymphon striatum]|nr:Seipin [Nymphon striatum]